MDPGVVRCGIGKSAPASSWLRLSAQSGLSSVQWSAGFALALVFVVFVANIVAIQYVKAAVAAAAEAGVRSGSVAGGSVDDCSRRAEEVLRGSEGLLTGPLGDAAGVVCRYEGMSMQAIGRATVAWWLGLLPPVRVEVRAGAPIEGDPRLLRTDLPRSSGSWP